MPPEYYLGVAIAAILVILLGMLVVARTNSLISYRGSLIPLKNYWST